MRTSRKERIDCPREDCEGVVSVTLEYEPADPMYGADADGNRGVYVHGYWTADAVSAACSLGHELTDAEVAAISKEAEEEATGTDDYEYYGPEGDEGDER